MFTRSQMIAHFGKLTVLFELDGSVVLVQKSFDESHFLTLSPEGLISFSKLISQIARKPVYHPTRLPDCGVIVELSQDGTLTLSQQQGDKLTVIADDFQSVVQWAIPESDQEK